MSSNLIFFLSTHASLFMLSSSSFTSAIRPVNAKYTNKQTTRFVKSIILSACATHGLTKDEMCSFTMPRIYTLPTNNNINRWWDSSASKVPNQKARRNTNKDEIQFPSAARDFSLEVRFQCRLTYSVWHPCAQLHASTSVRPFNYPKH